MLPLACWWCPLRPFLLLGTAPCCCQVCHPSSASASLLRLLLLPRSLPCPSLSQNSTGSSALRSRVGVFSCPLKVIPYLCSLALQLYAAVLHAVLSLYCHAGHNMRRAAAEGPDTCVLGSTSHVQQAHLAESSAPAAIPASCALTSQQPSEPDMHSAVHSCGLSVPQAPCLQTHISAEIHSMTGEAQREAQDSKAGEHTQLNSSHVHDGCHSSTAQCLQPRTCQQAAQPCSLQQEAQPAAHDGSMLRTSASCVFPGAAVDEQSSKTSSHGSVWVPQGSVSPTQAAQAKFQGRNCSHKRALGGVASHKSVRRSLRHRAKAAAMV